MSTGRWTKSLEGKTRAAQIQTQRLWTPAITKSEPQFCLKLYGEALLDLLMFFFWGVVGFFSVYKEFVRGGFLMLRRDTLPGTPSYTRTAVI